MFGWLLIAFSLGKLSTVSEAYSLFRVILALR
jgi:hypothetical protein